jgi:hypothetical protein
LTREVRSLIDESAWDLPTGVLLWLLLLLLLLLILLL